MKYGIRKGLEDIAWELKGIKNTLSAIWHSRYQDGQTDVLDPAAFSDEYISTEECAKRLGISDQTIRNWMALGRKVLIKDGLKESIMSMLLQILQKKQLLESRGIN